MNIRSVEYMGSFPSVSKCPKHRKVEYAFIGRSNVGKSSLINMLTGRKSLAKVSNTPVFGNHDSGVFTVSRKYELCFCAHR